MKRRKMGLPVTLAALALVSVVLVTAFGAVGASGKPAAAKAVIKVGYIGSQTGVSAAPGKAALGGAQTAVAMINAKGGVMGRKIKLIVVDDGSDVPKGLAAVTQLIQQEKVDAIIGPWSDYIAPAARPLAEKSKVPMINCYGPAKGAPTNWKWSFSIMQTARENAQAYMQILKSRKWKRVVAVGDVLQVHKDSISYTSDMAKKAKIKVTAMNLTWPLNVTDFGGIATQIKAACEQANAQVLLLQTNAPQLPSLMNSLKSIGFKLPVLGSPATFMPIPLFAQGTAPVQGIMFVAPGVVDPTQLPKKDPAKAKLLAFSKAYKKAAGMAPDFFASATCDAVNVYAAAVKKAGGTDKAKVQKALQGLKKWNGTLGTFNYSAKDHQTPNNGFWQWTVKGKGFKLVAKMAGNK